MAGRPISDDATGVGIASVELDPGRKSKRRWPKGQSQTTTGNDDDDDDDDADKQLVGLMRRPGGKSRMRWPKDQSQMMVGRPGKRQNRVEG